MKSGSVNGHYTMMQELHHEHLDHLLAAMRLHVKSQHNARGCAELVGVSDADLLQAPSLWKADIDGAFRRVPLREDHRWAAAVTWKQKGSQTVALQRVVCTSSGLKEYQWLPFTMACLLEPQQA